MSTLINKVKEHISDNRGKYGAATGAGAMYGVSKIDSPLVNQAGFNILAKGQNLALDAADKIDPRATATLNDLGMHKIRQEDIDASNALYNSGVAKYINPNPIDMVNANEHSTETYNKAMALKADAQDALVNAKNQGQDYIDQGINYVKGLNPFSESTIKIPIKSMLLEGYQPEAITEGIIRNNAMNSFNSNTNYLLDGSGRIIGLLPFGMVPGAIMGGIAGYKVGTHGKTGAGAAVGALIGKNGAMGALSTEDDDIRLRDIYRPKNIAINAAQGTLGGATIGGLTGGPVGALGGAAIGGTLGMVSPAIQYGIGKVGGKAGNYFSK